MALVPMTHAMAAPGGIMRRVGEAICALDRPSAILLAHVVRDGMPFPAKEVQDARCASVRAWREMFKDLQSIGVEPAVRQELDDLNSALRASLRTGVVVATEACVVPEASAVTTTGLLSGSKAVGRRLAPGAAQRQAVRSVLQQFGLYGADRRSLGRLRDLASNELDMMRLLRGLDSALK